MSAGLLTLLNKALALTKLSVMKTAGVIGDDLALNTKQLAHVPPERELPIVWEVAKGSLKNKAILIPSALALSAFAPSLIMPLLMVGGAYFCHEGVEKFHEKWTHRRQDSEEHPHDQALPPETPPEEQSRIRDAVKTDLVLSAEIVVLTLGMVAAAPLLTQAVAMAISGVAMTGLVYGSVAGLVKIDDIGAYLSKKTPPLLHHAGNLMNKAAPWLLKGLTLAGTVAMFTVGGGLLTHGIPPVHHLVDHVAQMAAGVPHAGGVLEFITSSALDGLGGILAGVGTVSTALGIRHAYNKVKSGLGFGKKNEDGKPGAQGKTKEPAPAPSADFEPSPSVRPAPDTKGQVPDAGDAFAQTAQAPINTPPQAGTPFRQAAQDGAEDVPPEIDPAQIVPPVDGPPAGTQPG